MYAHHIPVHNPAPSSDGLYEAGLGRERTHGDESPTRHSRTHPAYAPVLPEMRGSEDWDACGDERADENTSWLAEAVKHGPGPSSSCGQCWAAGWLRRAPMHTSSYGTMIA